MRNLRGQRFKRLFVVEEQEPVRSGAGKYIKWLCKCDCGKEVYVESAKLVYGNTGSCGCLQKDIVRAREKLPDGEANFNALYARYKFQASKKNRAFELSKEQFHSIVTQNCIYCGQIPEKHTKVPSVSTFFAHNGVDRVDSDGGYTLDNVVPCCKICNAMKERHSKQSFLSHIERIHLFQKGIQ